MDLKNIRRGRIKEYAQRFTKAVYEEGKRPWGLTEAEVALPSATQNELGLDEAKALVHKGCICVSEGANMPTTLEAIEFLIANGVLFGPGKAANAGGVATSALEMAQNSMHLSWTREEVDERLSSIMASIHGTAFETAEEYGRSGNLVVGANIAGFTKVADAMLDQGLV